MDRRTPDELVSYVEGFLNELYTHFSTNNRVSFKELQIKKNGKKYRLNSRLRCEIMKAEFNESHRFYSRKYNTQPTREAILSWIEVARELIVCDDKRRYEKNTDKILEKCKEYRKGRKEEIRQYNFQYYKINKPRIDEKFKADRYYEKNRERINRKRNERRARARALKKIQGLTETERINAFNKEFEIARPMIRNFFRSITNDYDDLVQEVYVEAYKSRNRYKHSTNMSAWAIRIGLNINLQWLKKRRIEKNNVIFVGEFDDDAMANAVSKISLEELFDEENQVIYPENTVEVIYSAMDELNMRDKEILELYMNGNSHAKIGEILNISENYSKARLYLIRTILAKKVEPLLNIKIKTYGNTDQNAVINRNASKKSYYFRKKTKEKDYGKSINVREKEEEVNGRIECSASNESSQCA